jgi:hypothetical protein
MFAEFFPVEFQQFMAMLGFFPGHFGKNLCRGRVFLAHALHQIVINPAIFLLGANRQRQNLALRKLGKIPHATLLRPGRCGGGTGNGQARPRKFPSACKCLSKAKHRLRLDCECP